MRICASSSMTASANGTYDSLRTLAPPFRRAAAEEERIEFLDFLHLHVFQGSLGLFRWSDALKCPAEDAWQIRGGDSQTPGQKERAQKT